MKTEKFKTYFADAHCVDCGVEFRSKNAHGLASQHHYKTGHTVIVDVQKSYVLTTRDSDWYKSWEAGHRDSIKGDS